MIRHVTLIGQDLQVSEQCKKRARSGPSTILATVTMRPLASDDTRDLHELPQLLEMLTALGRAREVNGRYISGT